MQQACTLKTLIANTICAEPTNPAKHISTQHTVYQLFKRICLRQNAAGTHPQNTDSQYDMR